MFLFITSSLFIILFHAIYIVGPTFFEPDSSNIIISLTTTQERFPYELPFTIHSLLSQTLLPKQIRIYLSPTSQIIQQENLTLPRLKMNVRRLDSSKSLMKLFHRLVEIRLEDKDYGPATKFIPIIKEFRSKPQAIMICDDDHYYHPFTVETLNEYSSKFPDSIIGFRGWRVRQDLLWGVRGKYEIAHHIIKSQDLSEAYRVGIITATSAYLIRSTFFNSRISLEFDQAPDDIRRVDDIWLNGQASKQNIPRYVIPGCCPHIDVTRTHLLEQYFGRNQMTRLSANTHALQWFGEYWEKHLWYRFHGENGPVYRNFLKTIYREWISILLRLKFILYFGYI